MKLLNLEELSPRPVSDIRDLEFRRKLAEKIPVWAAEARSHRNDKSWWPVKLASIQFWLPEGKYVLRPSDLGDDIDDYEFECVAWYGIESELRQMGALKTFYTGMLD